MLSVATKTGDWMCKLFPQVQTWLRPQITRLTFTCLIPVKRIVHPKWCHHLLLNIFCRVVTHYLSVNSLFKWNPFFMTQLCDHQLTGMPGRMHARLKYLLKIKSMNKNDTFLLCDRYWEQEVQVATKDLRKPSLSKTIIKCYWKSYALLGLFTLLEVSVC